MTIKNDIKIAEKLKSELEGMVFGRVTPIYVLELAKIDLEPASAYKITYDKRKPTEQKLWRVNMKNLRTGKKTYDLELPDFFTEPTLMHLFNKYFILNQQTKKPDYSPYD